MIKLIEPIEPLKPFELSLYQCSELNRSPNSLPQRPFPY